MSWFGDIREGLQGLPRDDRSLRRFGITMAVVLAALGIASLIIGRHTLRGGALLMVAVAFLLPALLKPQSLMGVRSAWMALALGIGWWVSRLLLLLSFVLLVTPLALIMRLVGRDPMARKWDPEATTYWIERPPTEHRPESYDKPY
jgi:hypothetical protein